MATRVDSATQPGKSRARSLRTNSQNAPYEMTSSTVSHVTREIVEPLMDEQRRELIAVTAYYLAERRHYFLGDVT